MQTTYPTGRRRTHAYASVAAAFDHSSPVVPEKIVTSETRRRGRALFDQQLWCWGQDIKFAGRDEHLLLAFGFARHRCPAGQTGSSCYHYRNGLGVEVLLWGGAMLYHDDFVGSVMLRRFDFAPVFGFASRAPDPCPSPDGPQSTMRPPQSPEEFIRARNLVEQAIHFMATYEDWVCERRGADYRRAILELWHKRPVGLPEDAGDTWRALLQSTTRADQLAPVSA